MHSLFTCIGTRQAGVRRGRTRTTRKAVFMLIICVISAVLRRSSSMPQKTARACKRYKVRISPGNSALTASSVKIATRRSKNCIILIHIRGRTVIVSGVNSRKYVRSITASWRWKILLLIPRTINRMYRTSNTTLKSNK